MSECTCVGCRKNPSLPSNNSKSRKALENNNNFEPIKADGFQDTTVNVGKCGPSWAPVAASPFRHGAFRPSNLQWIFIFHNPRVPNDDSFRPSICPMPMWCPPVLTWWYGRGNLRVPRSRCLGPSAGRWWWMARGLDPRPCANGFGRRAQDTTRNCTTGSSCSCSKRFIQCFWPWKIIDGQKRWWVGDAFLKDLVDVSC